MAFSTQQDFIKVAFLNESLEPVCPMKQVVKLKSYSSCTDSRAWAMNKEKQAHFLADLVACRNYAEDKSGGVCAIGGRGGKGGASGGGGGGGGTVAGESGEGEGGKGGDPLGTKAEGDSLLGHAQEKLEQIDNIIRENQQLRDKLQMSNEQIDILKDENKKIKDIVTKDLPPEQLSPFHEKLRELKAQGKISPDDEKTLLQMQKYLGCKDKEYKVLEAENNSLKRLVEKLAARAKVNKIPTEKETSTDVNYLQSLVNDLREEIGILRGLEEDSAKMKVDMNDLKSKYDALSSSEKEKRLNEDAKAMEAIITERNNLRDQLAKMVGIEDKIAILRKRAMDADRLEKEVRALKNKQYPGETAKNVGKGLKNDAKALEESQAERDCLRRKCTQLESELNELEELKTQNEEMCAELRNAHCKLKKMQCLEQELINTKKRLSRSEHALEDYECQMHQLMVYKLRLSRNISRITEQYSDLRALSVFLVQWLLKMDPSFEEYICYLTDEAARLTELYA